MFNFEKSEVITLSKKKKKTILKNREIRCLKQYVSNYWIVEYHVVIDDYNKWIIMLLYYWIYICLGEKDKERLVLSILIEPDYDQFLSQKALHNQYLTTQQSLVNYYAGSYEN